MSSPSNLNENLRSSKRLPISMPVVLSGKDSDGNAFLENTQTVGINRSGAKIVSKHSLSKGARLRIRIPHLDREETLTVVWVGEQRRDKYNIGVCFDQPSDFWGVDFPEEPKPEVKSAVAAGIPGKVVGVLQEFVGEALEAAIATVLRQTRQKAEDDLARARQEVVAQAQQLLRQEVESARARQEQNAAEASVRISALIAEAVQSGIRSGQDFLVADRTAAEARFRQSADQAVREVLGRAQEQLAQVAQRQNQDFERDLQDSLRSSVAGWGAFLADSERATAARVQEAISATVRQTLEQACLEAQASAVRAARLRLASLLCEFDRSLVEAESRAAGHFKVALGEATQDVVASAQNEAVQQTQVALRAAVESALEQLEMRAIGVVHHNEQACNQALTALADAHEARLSAHLAECQVKLSNSARKILQELARSLASLNFGAEKPVE